MEVKKARNRTVRRYHRSLQTGEVLPCVAVKEEDCRAEHLSERQAFAAQVKKAEALEARKKEKEAKKAESRRRRREAQTAYMRRWRERRAAEAEAKARESTYMDLIPDVPASWFVATVPDEEKRGLVERVEAVHGGFANQLRDHLSELPPAEQLPYMTVEEMVRCFEENKEWTGEDYNDTVICLGHSLDVDAHSDFIQHLNDVLFEMQDERLETGIDAVVSSDPELLSESLVDVLERLDVWSGLDDLYSEWKAANEERETITAHDFIVEHLADHLDELDRG